MPRIAVGGFQHETNTFSPTQADFVAFNTAGGWPALSRGEGMFASVDGFHIPVTGALKVLRAAGADIVPLVWCQATPCAHVTEDAFERIAKMMLDDIQAALAAGPLDGIYLDLHGAMVCEHWRMGRACSWSACAGLSDRICPSPSVWTCTPI